MAIDIEQADKVLGGLEDLLVSAIEPKQITQERGQNQEVIVTKINADTLPVKGKYGNPGFLSINDYLKTLKAAEIALQGFVSKNTNDIAGLKTGAASIFNEFSNALVTIVALQRTVANHKVESEAKLAQKNNEISSLQASLIAAVNRIHILEQKHLGGNGNIDIQAPTMVLKGLAIINITQGDTYLEQGVIVTDNVDTAIPYTTSGTVNDRVNGQYILTYKAEDVAGNKAQIGRTINVALLKVPTGQIDTADNGDGKWHIGVQASFTTKMILKDASGNIETANASDHTFKVTPNATRKYELILQNTNGTVTKERTYNVTLGAAAVTDTTAPVLTASPTSITIVAGNPMTYPSVTAIDAVDGARTVTKTADTVDASKAGTYKLTYSASDKSGNTGTVDVVVTVTAATVSDTTKPVITVNPSAVTIKVGDNIPAHTVTATDAITDNTTLTARIVTSGDTIDKTKAAVYTVRYNVSDDAGNTADEKTFVVTVEALSVIKITNVEIAKNTEEELQINVTTDTTGDTVTIADTNGNTYTNGQVIDAKILPAGKNDFTITAVKAGMTTATETIEIFRTPGKDLSITSLVENAAAYRYGEGTGTPTGPAVIRQFKAGDVKPTKGTEAGGDVYFTFPNLATTESTDGNANANGTVINLPVPPANALGFEFEYKTETAEYEYILVENGHKYDGTPKSGEVFNPDGSKNVDASSAYNFISDAYYGSAHQDNVPASKANLIQVKQATLAGGGLFNNSNTDWAPVKFMFSGATGLHGTNEKIRIMMRSKASAKYMKNFKWVV